VSDAGVRAKPAIALRPVAPADMDLLRRVYRTTREAELQLVDWTPEQKDAFIDHQFTAQHTHYQAHYIGAQFDVIVVDGVDAGRLYVHRRDADIRIIDIALLPEFRNRGVGTMLLRQLFDECATSTRTLSIHVEQFNPALRMYRRLGFVPIEERTPYLLMEWRP
jgi:ribosomal protein S18 acetylase RimI-like enzyme